MVTGKSPKLEFQVRILVEVQKNNYVSKMSSLQRSWENK